MPNGERRLDHDSESNMNHTRISNCLGTLIFCLTAWPSTSTAQQVFKCKDASGKVAYQSTPCANHHQESRPVILQAPALTDEEKFNAAAYAAGTTPSEARRLLQGPPASGEPSAATNRQAEADRQAQSQRATECNRRYDKLADDLRLKYGPAGQGNLAGRLLDLERDRSACIYGEVAAGGSRRRASGGASPVPAVAPTANRGASLGQCQGGCASEQGMCIAQCQANGSCISHCAASHGRCVARCAAY